MYSVSNVNELDSESLGPDTVGITIQNVWGNADLRKLAGAIEGWPQLESITLFPNDMEVDEKTLNTLADRVIMHPKLEITFRKHGHSSYYHGRSPDLRTRFEAALARAGKRAARDRAHLRQAVETLSAGKRDRAKFKQTVEAVCAVEGVGDVVFPLEPLTQIMTDAINSAPDPVQISREVLEAVFAHKDLSVAIANVQARVLELEETEAEAKADRTKFLEELPDEAVAETRTALDHLESREVPLYELHPNPSRCALAFVLRPVWKILQREWEAHDSLTAQRPLLTALKAIHGTAHFSPGAVAAATLAAIV